MDKNVDKDRLEEICTDYEYTIKTLERYNGRIDKELDKHKALLAEMQDKVTLQKEQIERQKDKTRHLEDQLSKQNRLIADMKGFIIDKLGASALETFYKETGRSSNAENNGFDSIHTQSQSDPVQPDSIPTQKRHDPAQHSLSKPAPLGESRRQNMMPSQDNSKSTHTLSEKDPNKKQSTPSLTSSTKDHSVQPYIETVRKKDERAKLHGASCKCCSKYYKASGALPGPDGRLLTPEERIQSSSRHRSRFKRERTPPAFWDDLDFISSQQVNGEKGPRSPKRSK
ncbi:hypothetical protein LRAMOSA09123 [Lichtheimia ramosa]|uniref:DNA endonuclease activator Ctp1 C-terminal domain-containing protein n=1 Tax=Lichtheimia ramosa TaxID=688394 RepID=A0A077WGU9_9FUNG|nr:hypothetical protein LRAMOSA09123 [Lichtheimia ramosa]